MLLFSAVCIACGLYYLIELAEEYTLLTKRILRTTILVLLPLHLLLLIYERFPLIPCLIGIVSHLAYLTLLTTFPTLSVTSTPFLVSAAMFVLDNYVWLSFFRSDHELFYRYRVAPFPATSAFLLLMVWLIPIALFCSLSVNDAVLPGGPGTHPQPKRRRNVLVAAFESLSAAVKSLLGKRDALAI